MFVHSFLVQGEVGPRSGKTEVIWGTPALLGPLGREVTEMTKAAMAASAEFTWSNAALQYEALCLQVRSMLLKMAVVSLDWGTPLVALKGRRQKGIKLTRA